MPHGEFLHIKYNPSPLNPLSNCVLRNKTRYKNLRRMNTGRTKQVSRLHELPVNESFVLYIKKIRTFIFFIRETTNLIYVKVIIDSIRDNIANKVCCVSYLYLAWCVPFTRFWCTQCDVCKLKGLFLDKSGRICNDIIFIWLVQGLCHINPLRSVQSICLQTRSYLYL